MRWPRKNDASSIEQRREAMGVNGSLVTSVDLEPFAGAAESLVGVAVIPVSAVPVEIALGPMCHVLWQWTTGDAVGPNMMTRNSYALNMAYVMQRAPVKPERAILEANMGGDKKPSAEFFQSGHGKTVLAEAFLSDEQIRRVLRTTAEDLEALSWAGTHGSVASGMQSVASTPASAIAALFAATGQDLGMVGTSSMAHGTARRLDARPQSSITFGGP